MGAGLGGASARVVAIALAVALGAAGAPDAAAQERIGFDAIFYRAAAGFHTCYSFSGIAGWSLRPIAGRVVHDEDDACINDDTPAHQATALRDCENATCRADCASYVRVSWSAGTPDELIGVVEPQGSNCADPARFGADHYLVSAWEDGPINDAVATARPGDWCSNPDHVVMLLRPVAPGSSTWRTWEASSAATGVGPHQQTLTPTWLRSQTRNDCDWPDHATALAESGCWHPPAERTGAPLLVGPVDGSVVDVERLDEVSFHFAQPENFPALGDYLIWVRWGEESERRDDDPDDVDIVWHHRLLRLPAFRLRAEPDSRLVEYPATPEGQLFPLSVAEAAEVELPFGLLGEMAVGIPTHFYDPETGASVAEWTEGSALTPHPPETFEADGLALEGDTTYFWRARVERFGFVSGAEQRTRATVVPPCDWDQASGVERVEYCREPEWSEEWSFDALECDFPDCPRLHLEIGPLQSTYGEAITWGPPHAVFRGAGELLVRAVVEPPPVAPPTDEDEGELEVLPLRYHWTFQGCDFGGAARIFAGEEQVQTDPAGGHAFLDTEESELRYEFRPLLDPATSIPTMSDECQISVVADAILEGEPIRIERIDEDANWLGIEAMPLYEVPIQFVQEREGGNAVSGAYCVFPDLPGEPLFYTYPIYGFDDQSFISRGRPDFWTWTGFLSAEDLRTYFGGNDFFAAGEGDAVWAFGTPRVPEGGGLLPIAAWNGADPFDPSDPDELDLWRESYADALRDYDGLYCHFEPVPEAE